ncbi:MAG: DUF2189 domain-containing protein [Kiloniellales bacterium]|nr:DUF2189 domain-containing protein [Kiloniellales bacterium]
MSEAVPVFSTPSPKIRQVGLDRPWAWLAAGWGDLRKAPAVSLGYGLVFALAGFAILAVVWASGISAERYGGFFVVLPLSAGFMLVGPIMAVGLYEVSSRLAKGETVSLGIAVSAFRRNPAQIALMGLALMLFLLFWIRLATLIFALFFASNPPDPNNLIMDVFFSAEAIPFLIVGVSVGAVLSALVFSISAVSIPMLLDRNVNVILAIATSVAAVRHNLAPMAVWAALIVLFTGAGLVTAYLGLVVALPLIGHATWHAYRDLVEQDG